MIFLLLIFALTTVPVFAFGYERATRARRLRESAQGLLLAAQSIHQVRRWKSIDARTFEGVDLSFYDTTQALLEAAGFSFVADLVQEDRGGPFRPFIRVMLGPEGTIVASFRRERRRDSYLTYVERRLITLESELTDLTYAITQNDPDEVLDPEPGIERLTVPYDVEVDQMLERHKRSLDSRKERPVAIAGLDGVLAFDLRRRAKRQEGRRLLGWVTERELRRIGPLAEQDREDLLVELRRAGEAGQLSLISGGGDPTGGLSAPDDESV